MRKIVAILCVFFATGIVRSDKLLEHSEYSVLAIRYVGDVDRPIKTILICTSHADSERYRTTILMTNEVFVSEHVVSSSFLAILIADAELFHRSGRQPQGKRAKWHQNVSVTLVTPQSKSSFLLNVKSGSSLLENLKKDCKDDNSLRSDLSDFQERIEEFSPEKAKRVTQPLDTWKK